jgi:hypothetical protein
MVRQRFKLSARVSSASPSAVRPILGQLITNGSVTWVADEFRVEAEIEGEEAKELNRGLLSALRKAEKRTRIRSEWTGEDGTTHRFFDYVLKKSFKG